MSFKDIFKKSFLSQFNSDLSTTSIVMALLITAVIAVIFSRCTGWFAGRPSIPAPLPFLCR